MQRRFPEPALISLEECGFSCAIVPRVHRLGLIPPVRSVPVKSSTWFVQCARTKVVRRIKVITFQCSSSLGCVIESTSWRVVRSLRGAPSQSEYPRHQQRNATHSHLHSSMVSRQAGSCGSNSKTAAVRALFTYRS